MNNVKFSIVVPVYNVEKYLCKCIDSILKQTYKNFELILVDDGSLDDSSKICDDYAKKDTRISVYHKKNGGLSDARNYGIKLCHGDYLILIDGDDYVESDYLEKVNKVLMKDREIDVLKFKLNLVDDDGNIIRKENGLNYDGLTNFNELIKLEFFEPAWSYVYNLVFWNGNNFTYMKGKIHEDFGLTPEIIMKANKIYYMNSYCYNYVQRAGSIMSSNSDEKLIKKAYDMLEQYDRLIAIKYNKDESFYKSFLSNSIINKVKTLPNKNERKKFKNELKKRNVIDNLLSDTFVRKIKKIVFKLFWGIL